jgi:hypothetical protein
MRVRPDFRARSGPEYDWSEMIEKNEGADRPALRRRQCSTNLESIAEITDRRKDHVLYPRILRRG